LSARQVFLRSLRVREEHKGKAGIDGTALAQSYVSLGNLLAEQPGRAEEALSYLRDALRCYREALGWEHPKVAWAHEGIAKALTKQGQLGAAQDHMDQAIHIRQKQAATTKSSGFERELAKDQKERDELKECIERRDKLKWAAGMAVAGKCAYAPGARPASAPTEPKPAPAPAVAAETAAGQRWRMVRGSVQLARGMMAARSAAPRLELRGSRGAARDSKI